MAEQYLSVGKLGKPHGLSGAFRFLLHQPFKRKKKLPPHFLLNIKGGFVPWFVAKIEMTNSTEGFITFEEVTSPEKAKQYSANEIYLQPKDIPVYFKQAEDEVDITGYTAIEEEKGEIGVVETILETPGQLLCSVKNGRKEVLIPLAEDFITKIDGRKKEITFNLPEGLLDL